MAGLQIGERHYRPVEIEIRQNNPGDNGRKRFTFIISSSSPDRHGSVIRVSGIDTTNYSANPVVLFNHNYDHVIGMAVNLELRGDKLIAQLEFDEQDDFARAKMGQVERGFLNAASIGFITKAGRYDEESDIFYVEQAELVEFSLVAIPSNPEALVLQRTAIDSLQSEIRELRSLIERNLTVSIPSNWSMKTTGGSTQEWTTVNLSPQQRDAQPSEEPAPVEAAQSEPAEDAETVPEESEESGGLDMPDKAISALPHDEEPLADGSSDGEDEPLEVQPVAEALPRTRPATENDYRIALGYLLPSIQAEVEKVLPSVRSQIRRELGKE